MLCFQIPNFMTFMGAGDYFHNVVLFRGKASLETTSPKSWNFSAGPSDLEIAVIKTDALKLNNMLGMIASTHPLFVVYDLQSATLSAGFDLSYLQTIVP